MLDKLLINQPQKKFKIFDKMDYLFLIAPIQTKMSDFFIKK